MTCSDKSAARLQDGSRVNIIIPPQAIDGPTISIRRFAKKGITLDMMKQQGNLSEAMATVLKIAARSGLNILISGGTGSGKTTLHNAMSQMIYQGERIVTIEDAAELQSQQPHVVRLETRPPNLEGNGEITMRNLVKNALRISIGDLAGATSGYQGFQPMAGISDLRNFGTEPYRSIHPSGQRRVALTRPPIVVVR